MVESNSVRAVVMNLVSALIIAVVVSYFLFDFKLTQVLYIGNLFGLYFLVVFGTEILIESGKLQNNYKRFVFVIVNTIIFDVLFLILVPMIFGKHILDPVDNILLSFGGFEYNLVLNSTFYMTIFALMMLVFNYLLYRKTRSQN